MIRNRTIGIVRWLGRQLSIAVLLLASFCVLVTIGGTIVAWQAPHTLDAAGGLVAFCLTVASAYNVFAWKDRGSQHFRLLRLSVTAEGGLLAVSAFPVSYLFRVVDLAMARTSSGDFSSDGLKGVLGTMLTDPPDGVMARAGMDALALSLPLLCIYAARLWQVRLDSEQLGQG
ncbi:hypothetical protein [Skermanella pratensis]|uniref:hypothetical protein n=1 Tax=Skermanella pratensis TaxID=2233999 RepID=UPI0013011A6F|nr:hypothetical protein [Skermanella pratensis]